MPRFELNKLTNFDDKTLIAELQRVAKLVTNKILTVEQFQKHAKVSASTIRTHFGGWKEALVAAGLDSRYGGKIITVKMKVQTGKSYSDQELLELLQSTAKKLNADTITKEQFNAHTDLNASILLLRFGSWNNALAKAGLTPSPTARRYADEDYFENLLSVWTHYGHQPVYGEMQRPPSHIPPAAYLRRWGSWKNALLAFVEKANSDIEAPTPPIQPTSSISNNAQEWDDNPSVPMQPLHRRTIPLGLRYSVLRRDRFRCVKCGSNPATDPTCELHIDHIVPFSKGGATSLGNLQTLCEKCNLGKSDRLES